MVRMDIPYRDKETIKNNIYYRPSDLHWQIIIEPDVQSQQILTIQTLYLRYYIFTLLDDRKEDN